MRRTSGAPRAPRWTTCVAMCSLAALQAHAADPLTFREKTRDFTPGIDERQITCEFPFANQTAEPVTILSLQTSCGCTTAALDKKRYEPGESGVLVGTFEIGDRVGFHENSIVVTSDVPEAPRMILRLRAHLPGEEPAISEKFLRWPVPSPGVDPADQAVTVVFPEGSPFLMTGIRTDERYVRATYAKQDDRHYTITARPTVPVLERPVPIEIVTNHHAAFRVYCSSDK